MPGWRGWCARTETRPSAVKGRGEEHGGKRIGLAWKMGRHKEDNGARCCCCEQRVRSEQWPRGRRTHVQSQKTRGSSCLWLLDAVPGCLQSEVIDYRIRLVLFWPCDFRCCNLSPLCIYPCSKENSAGTGMLLGETCQKAFPQTAFVILPLLSSVIELISNWQRASC